MDLLEYVKEQLGKEQISDLPGAVNEKMLPIIFRNVNIEDFTLKQWNDVLSYLFRRNDYTTKESMSEIYSLLKRKK